jgi:hypothetical protein
VDALVLEAVVDGVDALALETVVVDGGVVSEVVVVLCTISNLITDLTVTSFNYF